MMLELQLFMCVVWMFLFGCLFCVRVDALKTLSSHIGDSQSGGARTPSSPPLVGEGSDGVVVVTQPRRRTLWNLFGLFG